MMIAPNNGNEPDDDEPDDDEPAMAMTAAQLTEADELRQQLAMDSEGEPVEA